VVLRPNRIIRKRTDANCTSFHLRVFQGLSNPQGQRQTSIISIPRDNFGERKAKFNLEMSGTTQMQLYSKESTQGAIVEPGSEGPTVPI
jgi:hypothetical protein